jgi:hypothetical protein
MSFKSSAKILLMNITQLTKAGIAKSQLDVALTFYLEDRELISAITLAGAAEEILGKLCEKEGKPTSLEHHTKLAHAVCKYFLNSDQDEKSLRDSINRPRNELKHLTSGDVIEVDTEFEAGEMLARAIGNYECLFGSKTDKMCLFELKHKEASDRLFPRF